MWGIFCSVRQKLLISRLPESRVVNVKIGVKKCEKVPILEKNQEKTRKNAFFLQKVLENKNFAVYLQCQKETMTTTGRFI